jgi:hypothetical protein
VVVAVVVLLLVALAVVMALLARPLLGARSEAEAARTDLEAAKADLTAGHVADAKAQIAAAREHVDAAHSDIYGFGADVWSVVPVAGGAVHDARHLVDAMSETAIVGQEGVKLYPYVTGKQASLVNGQRIDLHTLGKVVAGTKAIGTHLNAALADLDQVQGSTPVVGAKLLHEKEAALGYLDPIEQSYDQTGALVSSLPEVVGADGPRTYLLAVLNPAELRYSGGGTLSFNTVHFNNGAASFGRTVNGDNLRAKGDYQVWPRVPGNTFRTQDRSRVTNATFSPWWSVSGEELLRGYQKAFPGQHFDGAIAIDPQALANLFTITGPVQMPGFGTVTSTNLVQKLIGSYGDYSTALRHRLNKELVTAFRTQFFEGGKTTKKLEAMQHSAQGRHFFAYFRNGAVERSFQQAALAGNLSDTPNDYLGVFTQNLNGSKVDYWQHRTVVSDVHLSPSGSAVVELKTTVTNDAPAYAGPGTDPGTGYGTRFLGALVGTFLPDGAKLGPVSVDGKPAHPVVHVPHVKTVHNRPYFQSKLWLDSGQSWTQIARYRVPHAAVLGSDGNLVYRLDIDPQDTVVPEQIHVHVSFPKGWTAPSLPSDWKASGSDGASLLAYGTRTLSYEIPLHHG